MSLLIRWIDLARGETAVDYGRRPTAPILSANSKRAAQLPQKQARRDFLAARTALRLLLANMRRSIVA